MESSDLGECVNYNLLLKKLSGLKSINKNLISLNSFLNTYNTNNYVWNKYSLENANRSLESIENTVDRLINIDNVRLLDSCKLLLNFKPNYKFVQLISANIDFYGKINNLYYLLKYVLNFNTLNNNSSCDTRDNNNLIRDILDRMCSNFSEIGNKIETLDLLYNFSVFHDDYAHLIYNYVTTLDNIDVLKNNISVILDYFNRYNNLVNASSTSTASVCGYDLTEFLELYLDNTDMNMLKTDHLLTVFKYLLLTNLADKYTNHLEQIFMNVKLTKLSHILPFFDSLNLNSYPYLFYLSSVDNHKILSVLTHNINFINVMDLIAITSVYLLYFNSVKPETTTTTVQFVRFLNLCLTNLFNYYNSVVGNASLFKHLESIKYNKSPNSPRDSEDTLPNPYTHTNNGHKDSNSIDYSEHISQDSLLKLTRRINKLLYNIADLYCLTYNNLDHMATFLNNYDYLVKYLTTPYSKLGSNYVLLNLHGSNTQLGTRDNTKLDKNHRHRETLVYFNDLLNYGLNDYLLVDTTSSSTSSCSRNTTSTTASGGGSRLHSEVSNVLQGMNICNFSNEVTVGPYRVDILLSCF